MWPQGIPDEVPNTPPKWFQSALKVTPVHQQTDPWSKFNVIPESPPEYPPKNLQDNLKIALQYHQSSPKDKSKVIQEYPKMMLEYQQNDPWVLGS